MSHSSASYHTIVKKSHVANLKFRLWILEKCRLQPKFREAVWQMCADDLIFFVNVFVWTYDPRLVQKDIPFITWEWQDDSLRKILESVVEGRDLIIEKSRDMGATWMCLLVFLWLWWFHRGYAFLMLSHKEELVEDPGDMDALFSKIDFVLARVPGWLKPNEGKPEIKWRRKKHLENLDNGSIIDGDSTTGKAGVGGRRTAILVDEFSRMRDGQLILEGTADTTRCRIFNFTPFGSGNPSHSLALRSDLAKLRLHWSVDPRKNAGMYRWNLKKNCCEYLDPKYQYDPHYKFIPDGILRSPVYDKEEARRGRRTMAEMWDIDYAGSTYQYFDQVTISHYAALYADDPYWEGDILLEGPGRGRLHRVKGGPVKLWCHLDHDSRPILSDLGYAAGADVSQGRGATNSCLSVGNADTGEKVLEYATPYTFPLAFAENCMAICNLFRSRTGDPTYLVWERQGPGDVFGAEVIRLGYKKIYFHVNKTAVKGGRSPDPGWYPSDEAKLLVMEHYRSALQTFKCLNRSQMALDETLLMIFKGGRIEHSGSLDQRDPTGAGVNHGDRVVADALMWHLILEMNGGEFGKLRAEQEKNRRPDARTLAGRKLIHDEIEKQRQEGWVA
jgi:hypothetical protein